MSALPERIRAGDRHAAAELVLAESSLIRRRYRQRLDRSLRRLCDSQDLVSTILRRLDRMVSARAVRASSVAELRALVYVIAEHALADKSRVLRRLERSEQRYGLPESQTPASDVDSRGASDIDSSPVDANALTRSIPDSTDRQLLSLWLLGNNLHQAAAALDIEPATIRKRWQRLRHALRRRLEGSLRDDSFLRS